MIQEIRTYSKDKSLVEERRREIVLTAAKLFLHKGYGLTTMRELAHSLNLSPGALYHYIGSKEDIIQMIIDFSSDILNDRLEKTSDAIKNLRPAEALAKTLELNIAHVDQYRHVVIVIHQTPLSADLKGREEIFENVKCSIAFYEDILRKGVEAGEFDIDDVHACASTISQTAQMWATRRFFFREYSMEKYIVEQTRLAMRMVGVDSNIPHVSNGVVKRKEVTMSGQVIT